MSEIGKMRRKLKNSRKAGTETKSLRILNRQMWRTRTKRKKLEAEQVLDETLEKATSPTRTCSRT